MVTLHDIMSVDIVTVSPEATLRDVAELLSDRHISGVPVTSGDRVVAVISTTDLLEFDAVDRGVPTQRTPSPVAAALGDADRWDEESEPPAGYFSQLWDDAGADVVERLAQTTGPEWNVLEEHTVGELMTHRLLELPPTTDVRDAAELMLRAGVHRILVMEGGRLVGVVSTMDLVKAVSQHGLGG